MAVHWTPQSSKPSVADHRDVISWRESKRYKEIVKAQNERVQAESATTSNNK